MVEEQLIKRKQKKGKKKEETINITEVYKTTTKKFQSHLYYVYENKNCFINAQSRLLGLAKIFYIYLT